MLLKETFSFLEAQVVPRLPTIPYDTQAGGVGGKLHPKPETFVESKHADSTRPLQCSHNSTLGDTGVKVVGETPAGALLSQRSLSESLSRKSIKGPKRSHSPSPTRPTFPVNL